MKYKDIKLKYMTAVPNKGAFHVFFENGDEAWIKDGEYHRVGGPAEISDDMEAWYRNGECHRVGGPAITKWNNKLIEIYCLNDVDYTKQDYWNKMYKMKKISKRELLLKLL